MNYTRKYLFYCDEGGGSGEASFTPSPSADSDTLKRLTYGESTETGEDNGNKDHSTSDRDD